MSSALEVELTRDGFSIYDFDKDLVPKEQFRFKNNDGDLSDDEYDSDDDDDGELQEIQCIALYLSTSELKKVLSNVKNVTIVFEINESCDKLIITLKGIDDQEEKVRCIIEKMKMTIQHGDVPHSSFNTCLTIPSLFLKTTIERIKSINNTFTIITYDGEVLVFKIRGNLTEMEIPKKVKAANYDSKPYKEAFEIVTLSKIKKFVGLSTDIKIHIGDSEEENSPILFEIDVSNFGTVKIMICAIMIDETNH